MSWDVFCFNNEMNFRNSERDVLGALHVCVLIWIGEITHVSPKFAFERSARASLEMLWQRDVIPSAGGEAWGMKMLVKYIIPTWQCNSLICAPPAATAPATPRRVVLAIRLAFASYFRNLAYQTDPAPSPPLTPTHTHIHRHIFLQLPDQFL